jgi:hypothetical protein
MAVTRCVTRHSRDAVSRDIIAGMNERPTPIPLRPDVDALRSANVTTLMRHCFRAANRALNPAETRAAQVPATTTGSGWADKLSTTVVSDFIASLVPLSAGARLLEAAPKVDLSGVGSILFPRRSGAISATAVPWVTEGDPAPVLQFVLDAATLDSAKKLIGIVVLTRELFEHSAANVVMKRLLAENVSAALDASLFSNVAATTARPAGILNGVSGLTAATAGAGAMVTDLSALAKAIAPVTTGLVFVAHPAQAAMINLNRGVTFPNVEVWPTLGVAAGTVIALDPAAFVSAFGPDVDISASTETLLHMESTTPLPFATGAQGSGVLATPARSMFQVDAVALKIKLRASWAWRVSGAVAWVASTNW